MTILKSIGFALTGLLIAASSALAHDYQVGKLEIHHPHSRATLPGQPVAGGYLSITSSATEADKLVSISSPRAGMIQIHSMTMEGDVMKMAQLPDGLEIPAGATVELKHGGIHIMFMSLTAPFAEGEEVPATLVFEKAGKVDVVFKVGPANGDEAEHEEHAN